MAITFGNNYTLVSPAGVDASVQRVQNHLFKMLNWQKVDMYGRVSKVPHPEQKTAFTPQAYIRDKEYVDVLRNDKSSAQVFFVLADRSTTSQGALFTTECKIVFMLNLKEVYPTQVDRADTKAQEDVITALSGQGSFTVTSIGTGIKECLGEFDTENIKFTDIQPNHIFCVTGQLSYTISCYN